MGKKSDITAVKIAQVIVYINDSSLSNRKIAEKLNIAPSTVDRIKRNHKQDLNPIKNYHANRASCRGQMKTTPRTDRRIRDCIVLNRRESLKKIQLKLVGSGIDISKRTLQRRAKKFGLMGRRPRQVPRMTPTMMKKRLEWAKQHQHCTLDFWRSVSCIKYNNLL
jgi:IS30 family transposase